MLLSESLGLWSGEDRHLDLNGLVTNEVEVKQPAVNRSQASHMPYQIRRFVRSRKELPWVGNG